jgi:hypothetical protein
MAIFSSSEAADAIQASPVPKVDDILPDIKFRGTDCRSITVTLENTVAYTRSDKKQVKRRMQKIYSVESSDIQRSNSGPFGNSSERSCHGTPSVFVMQSVAIAAEQETNYEAYKLNLWNLKKDDRSLYKKRTSAADVPTKYLADNKILIEFKKNAANWSFITISSLLIDLLQSCPSVFLKPCIVGNYKFPNQNLAKGEDGKDFKFDATLDVEGKWNQFLQARADKLKSHLFGTRNLGIITKPAIKITSTPAGDDILAPHRNELVDLFQLADHSPDVAKLRELKLEKESLALGEFFFGSSRRCRRRR